MLLMKLYRIILPIFMAGVMSGCGKWLDVIPEDNTTEDLLFSDYGGYHSALNGIYQTMASPELYGQNLTWGYLSALSQYYDNYNIGNTMPFSYTEQYDYASDEVKAFGEEIWRQGYFVIANCNNLLQHLAEADPEMFPNNYMGEMDMLKGEALAARALMHFDLLRLFAEAPAVNMDGMAIPYSKTYPDMFPQRLTTGQVLDNVLADFREAASLLQPIDSTSIWMVGAYNRYSANNSDAGLFFKARGFRLNYVAVRSLMARVYAYAGDMKSAYDCAAGIFKTFKEEESSYSYSTFSSSAQSDAIRHHKMIDGMLVSFYSATLVNDYLATGATGNSETNPFRLKNLDYIFADADDYRNYNDEGNKLIYLISNEYLGSLKYIERTGGSNTYESENCLLPVMRLSELALIMAEYLVSQNNIADAVSILNELRQARGCQLRTLQPTATAEEINEEIRMESWRENVAEGQYFFFCKRKNLPTIMDDGVIIQMEGKYTMQIPDSETSMN